MSQTITAQSARCTYLERPNKLQAARDTGKFRDHVAEVDDQNPIIMKKVMRNPNSSRIRSLRPLPVTAPMRAADLLHYDQGHGNGNQGPQQHVAKLRTGRRIGLDAVGIVVDVGGNETGSDDGEEDQDPDFPAFPESHAEHCDSFSDRPA